MMMREPYKIQNGSEITIGGKERSLKIYLDQHFNWFQKKMIKWCFGIVVKDYKEGDQYV